MLLHLCCVVARWIDRSGIESYRASCEPRSFNHTSIYLRVNHTSLFQPPTPFFFFFLQNKSGDSNYGRFSENVVLPYALPYERCKIGRHIWSRFVGPALVVGSLVCTALIAQAADNLRGCWALRRALLRAIDHKLP